MINGSSCFFSYFENEDVRRPKDDSVHFMILFRFATIAAQRSI